jgi:hypothetical protein
MLQWKARLVVVAVVLAPIIVALGGAFCDGYNLYW